MKYLTKSEIDQIRTFMRDYSASVKIYSKAVEINCKGSFADVVDAAMKCSKHLADITLKGEIIGRELICRFIKN